MTRSTRRWRQWPSGLVALALLFAGMIGSPPPARAAGTISLTTAPYIQSFDGILASAGASSVVPPGWAFAETGTNANSSYQVSTGSSTTGTP